MNSSDEAMSPLARPWMQVAIGGVVGAIAFPYLWFSGMFGYAYPLLVVLVLVTTLATVFIRRLRWFAIGALIGMAAAVAYMWATAGESVAPIEV